MTDFILGLVIDRSGSMGKIAKEAISGLNSFLDEYRDKRGELHLSMFNNKIEQVYRGQACDAPVVTAKMYKPDGMTALYDAIMGAIETVEGSSLTYPQMARPAVVIAIMTDGYENCSKTSVSTLKSAIEDREALGWRFVYLGANVNVEDETEKMGMKFAYTQAYVADARGIASGYAGMSSLITQALTEE